MTDRTRPPALLVEGGLAPAADDLRRDGWSVQQGFTLPTAPWDLGDDRRACTGPVDDTDSAAAALLAATRGAALAVAVALSGAERARFLGDLRRVADVSRRAGAEPEELPLDDEQRRLLECIAAGNTTAEAADELHVSLRTAERKLGAARRALGVTTTAEAVVRVRGARRDAVTQQPRCSIGPTT